MLTNTDGIDSLALFVSSFLGIVIAIVVTVFSKNKWFFRKAQCLSISKKHGDISVWDHLFNLEGLTWIFVRDHKNRLLYRGLLSDYSTGSEDPALVLTQVSVYKENDDSHLYDLEKIYLSRNREDITIEIRPSKTTPDLQKGITKMAKSTRPTPRPLKEGPLEKGAKNPQPKNISPPPSPPKQSDKES